MIQLAAGIVLGMMISAVTAMVVSCIYLEKKYPEIRDSFLAEMED